MRARGANTTLFAILNSALACLAALPSARADMSAGVAVSVWVDSDADLDGLPDSWETQYFGHLATANASSDFDGDHFPDLHEYLAGTDPTDERALLLACYNAGPKRVLRAGFDLRRLPASTRSYVDRATALHDYYLAGDAQQVQRLLVAQISPHARPTWRRNAIR